MKDKSTSGRRFGQMYMAVITSVVGLLAFTVSPASAATYSGGTGLQTHVGVPFSGSPACAHYTEYNADVAFPNGVNATITSNPGAIWNEGPGGTAVFTDRLQNTCNNIPQTISDDRPGNSPLSGWGQVTLTGAVNNCVFPASYLRSGLQITVTQVGAAVAGTCSGTILNYDLRVVAGVTACDSPIAPSACAIGPAVP